MKMCRELTAAEIEKLEIEHLSIHDVWGEDKYIKGVHEFVKALFKAAQVKQTER